MTLYNKRIPVKGKFVKETSGYREADVQEFLNQLKLKVSVKVMGIIDKLAGEELAYALALEGDEK